MITPWKQFAAGALALYLAILAIAFAAEWQRRNARETHPGFVQNEQGDAIANSRKNYASAKQVAPGPAGQPIGNSQKYEKIASLTQRTSAFEADRSRIDAAIAANQGIVQIERGTGLVGRRVLHLGIGVPPEKFEGFIAAARAIGKTALVTTVKNDKTNEYLQLRAKRATLEKTRAALDALQGSGGSIDERIHVQNELSQVEEKIQDLGVSLGDFDTQNELCTVKLTLDEAAAPVRASFVSVFAAALGWATLVYAGLGAGFAALMLGAWVALVLFNRLRGMARETGWA